jgi:chromosome segregation ATPase
LSEEVNDFEHDKRAMSKLKKQILGKDAELKRVKAELEQAKSDRPSRPTSIEASISASDVSRISQIQQELDKLQQSFQDFQSNPQAQDDGFVPGDDDDQWSAVPRNAQRGPPSDSGDTIPIYEDDTEALSSTRNLSNEDLARPIHQDEHDAALMGLELASARQAKQSFLRNQGSFRRSLDANEIHFADSPAKRQPELSSPGPKVPLELQRALSKQLKAANARADDAQLALAALEGEVRAVCSTFSDDDTALAGLKAMADHFLSVRLELERLMPGETTLGLHENAKLFPELVRKIQNIMTELSNKNSELQSLNTQKQNLKGNFDHSLHALDKANGKIAELNETIEKMSEEMLESRIRAKKAEERCEERDNDNEKLRESLLKYQNEVKRLESLITTMEAEHRVALSDVQTESMQLRERAGIMEAQVASETTGRRKAEESAVSRLRKIQDLEEKLNDARARAQEVEQQLNGRVTSLTAALVSATEETERLKKLLKKCEKKYRDEVYRGSAVVQELRDEMVKAAMRVTEGSKAHRRKSKVELANYELFSDDVMAETEEDGAQPMTPSSVVRFADYSEVRDLGEEDGESVDDGGENESLERAAVDEDHVPGSVEVARGKKKSVLLTSDLDVTKMSKKGKRRYDSGVGFGDSDVEEDAMLDDSGLATPDLSSDAGMEMDDTNQAQMAF